MKKLIAALWVATACIGAVLTVRPVTSAAQGKDQDGFEVLTRGPMHEAYAAPQALNPTPAPIVPKQPPEPVAEMPPDQKPDGSQVVWISGYWAWDDEMAEYVWLSGFWRDVPPGKQWVPGHWTAQDGGYQWISGLWAGQQQTEITYVPPPPQSLETGPSIAAPGDDHFYAHGVWVYIDRKYRWRPGLWLKYRPNLVFVPAHYVWTPAGCVYIDGHWDYELTRRGLLFCPIRFTANVWTRPGWRFAPRFLVYPEVIVGALFVRIDYHRFSFGDYFGARFREHGFVPWVDYRLHKQIPDPLFHQYAYARRTEVNWERDLRKLYDDRRTGLAPRPPQSFAQQVQFQRDLVDHKAIKTATKTFAVTNVKVAERNLMMVSTLTTVDKKVVPLRTLTPAARAEVIKTVEHHNKVIIERKTTEKKIVAQKGPFVPGDAHHVGNLPAVPLHLKTPGKVTIPPAPVLPKHVDKVAPKYEPPKAPKASPKPLPMSSLDRLPTALAAAVVEAWREPFNGTGCAYAKLI